MLTPLAVLLALSPSDSLDLRRADLLEVVRAYAEPVAAWDSTAVRLAWADVNGDGHDDALVVLGGEAWCDAGGCTALLLETITGEDTAELGPFRPVAEIGGVRVPVHLADVRAGTWCDLIATGADGQLHRLAFDGETYPYHVDEAPALSGPRPTGPTLFAEAD
jgi:hypothetical protein